jgi:hypothetical protein
MKSASAGAAAVWPRPTMVMSSRVMRARIAVLSSALVVLGIFLIVWRSRPARRAPESPPSSPLVVVPGASASPDSAPTRVYAHNLMLRKGPNFRIYVRWLRGEMTRTRPHTVPSFDDIGSFFLNVKTGVIRANIGDIGNFLNAGVANSPLKNIKLSAAGDLIKLTGTLRKIVPLPIEMTGTIAAASGNRIHMHVTKLNVLKIPVKGLLGTFRVSISDLFDPRAIAGIQVSGDDIFFDTQVLLPPPHLRGELTKVRIVSPDIEEVYGNAEKDVAHVEQWRNFLRLRDGALDFGKLTMHDVDLIMIDVSSDAWFDLDLAHYQRQLVSGYTRMTPQAGLQIFMPDVDNIPNNKENQSIGIEWLKNRNTPVPPDVAGH